MLRTLAFSAAVSLLAGTAASRMGHTASDAHLISPPDSTDQEVVTFLINANQAEVSQARAALAGSQNNDVRRFAQKMITDHGKGLTKIQEIGKRLGYAASDSVSQSPDMTAPKDTTMVHDSTMRHDTTMAHDSTMMHDSTVVRDTNNSANQPYPRNNDSAGAGQGGNFNDAEYVSAQVSA